MDSLVQDVDYSEIPHLKSSKSLLNDYLFYLSRETPYEILSILIHSYGGSITNDKTNPKLTHIITDRDIDTTQYKNIDIVQSQWLVDCCNFDILLPVNE